MCIWAKLRCRKENVGEYDNRVGRKDIENEDLNNYVGRKFLKLNKSVGPLISKSF